VCGTVPPNNKHAFSLRGAVRPRLCLTFSLLETKGAEKATSRPNNRRDIPDFYFFFQNSAST
jgi:hypothetical protein